MTKKEIIKRLEAIYNDELIINNTTLPLLNRYTMTLQTISTLLYDLKNEVNNGQ